MPMIMIIKNIYFRMAHQPFRDSFNVVRRPLKRIHVQLRITSLSFTRDAFSDEVIQEESSNATRKDQKGSLDLKREKKIN